MARIYVSSTFKDLKVCREKVRHSLRQIGHEDIAMEYYVAGDERPLDKCQKDVASCDLYIGIFAWRYGYVPKGQDKSITELEYRKATETGKKCLIFLLHEEALWPRNFIDKGKDLEKIEALRNELSTDKMVSFFNSADELASLVNAAVYNCEKESKNETPKADHKIKSQYNPSMLPDNSQKKRVLFRKTLQLKLPPPQAPDPLTQAELEQYKLRLTCYNFDNNAENYDDALVGADPMQRRNLIRLLWSLKRVLEKRFNGWKPDSWLDAGCGTGLMPRVLKHPKNTQCCGWLSGSKIRAGFDYASNMVELANRKRKDKSYTKVFKGDLLTITPKILEQEIGKPNVDLIIANNVIHWLLTPDNIDLAFKNLLNILTRRGIFAASIAAEGTASTFLGAYKTIMEEEMKNYMPMNKVEIWSSHLCNPIGLQTVCDIVQHANKNNFRVEVANYVYEPVDYEGGTDDYVDDARAYGEYLFMAPLLSHISDEKREEIWEKIKTQFKKDYHEKFNQTKYMHDQYMIYLIVSREN